MLFFCNDTASTGIYTLSYTTLFRSGTVEDRLTAVAGLAVGELCDLATVWLAGDGGRSRPVAGAPAESAARVLALAPVRSEEHTTELQSRQYIVCRLLFELKN